MTGVFNIEPPKPTLSSVCDADFLSFLKRKITGAS